MRARGNSLIGILLLCAVLVVLLLAVANLASFQVHQGLSLSNRQQAENLARSALVQALARLLDDPNLGNISSTRIPLSLPVLAPECQGLVTFDPDEGVPYSLNNVNGAAAVVGWNQRPVPPGSVHLVATARVGGLQSVVEALVSLPALPTVGTESEILSPGGLTLASLEGPDKVAGYIADRRLANLPADLCANSPGSPAVRLGPQTLIRGDVRTPGTVSLPSDGSARVLGQVYDRTRSFPLPTFNLSDFDPQALSQPFTALTQLPGGTPVNGRARFPGPVTVNGDLVLVDGLLYVAGNLHVTGGIRGKGAVVAEGNVTVDSGCSLDAGHSLALLAGGNVSLTGVDRQSSAFQGLVYCGGSFAAQSLTLIGQIVSRGAGAVRLGDCAVVGVPQQYRIRIVEPQPRMIWSQTRTATNNQGVTATYKLEVSFVIYRDPANPNRITPVSYARRTGPAGPESWGYTGGLFPDAVLNGPDAADRLWGNFQFMSTTVNLWPFSTGLQANPNGTFDVTMKASQGDVPRPGYSAQQLLRDTIQTVQGEDLLILQPSRFLRWQDDARVVVSRVVP